MQIVWVRGGLGNQLFQYAFAKAYSIKNNCEVFFDISYIKDRKLVNDISINGGQHTYYGLKLYKTRIKIATEEQCAMVKEMVAKKKNNLNVLGRLFNATEQSLNNFIKEKSPGVYDPSLFEYRDNVYIMGYMETEKYFKQYRDEILKDLTLDIPLDTKNLKMLELIKSTNAVSIHIRRGDYLYFTGKSQILPTSYYLDAIKYIISNTESPHFFLFSNDIPWVRKNLSIDAPYTVVDINPPNKGYFDLELMRNCKHSIIANSTFSWWGAWLNESIDKIILAPKPWFFGPINDRYREIVPESWIKIQYS